MQYLNFFLYKKLYHTAETSTIFSFLKLFRYESNSIIEKAETEAEEKRIQTSGKYEDNFVIEKIP